MLHWSNMFRCASSYILSRMGIYRFRHEPLSLSIEPADRCMLRCPQCPVGIRTKVTSKDMHQMSPDNFKIILDQCATVEIIQFFFQGEPLLNRQLPLLIKMAKERGIYTIVSTNGLLLDEDYAEQLVLAGVDRVIFSIDGLTQQSYEQYRVGGKIEDALRGMHNLADAKERTHAKTTIEWQCLMLSSNEHEWYDILKTHKEFGADRVVFKSAQFYDFEDGNSLMPKHKKACRYQKNKDGKYELKKKCRNRCSKLWTSVVIDAQGNVLPCCFDKERKYILGNIFERPLNEIWFSKRAVDFRKQVLSNRKNIDICRNCTE